MCFFVLVLVVPEEKGFPFCFWQEKRIFVLWKIPELVKKSCW